MEKDGIVAFIYSHLRSDVDDSSEEWQILLRVTADFQILYRGNIFYEEVEFPVIEFADQARKWIVEGGCFEYHSMETDDNPMIYFSVFPGDELMMGAVGANTKMYDTLKRSAVRDAISEFIIQLEKDVMEKFGIDIKSVLV